MYLEKIFTLLTNFYHAYTLYAIAILVVLVILFIFKTKAMAKFSGLILALVVVIYIAGLIQQGISSSSEKKKAMTEKSQQYDK